MSDNFDLVKSFRQTAPYINSHRGKTFVIMFPGGAITHENFSNIVQDIALLSTLGVKLVLVHGARQQIDDKLQQHSIEGRIHKHQRITDETILPLFIDAVGGAKLAVEAALSTGLPNSPMHNSGLHINSGNWISARPCGVVDGIDMHYTGRVRKVNHEGIKQALSTGAIGLISPLGYSLTGELFNLAYTEVAEKVAVAIGADKLIAFTKEHGMVDDDGTLYRELNLLQCEKLLLRQNEDDSHQSLRACYRACDQGVMRAQIISYCNNGALIKELFTRDGTGTMVHRDSYESIRRARITDVGGIIELIAPLEAEGILVKRSRELLEQEIEHFVVMDRDGLIIACAALYPFEKEQSAEIACMATHSEYRGKQCASKLLKHIEKQASELKIKRLFVLTTQSSHWFLEQGFSASNIDVLPNKKQQFYNYQRNSKVFIKEIS